MMRLPLAPLFGSCLEGRRFVPWCLFCYRMSRACEVGRWEAWETARGCWTARHHKGDCP